MRATFAAAVAERFVGHAFVLDQHRAGVLPAKFPAGAPGRMLCAER